MRSSDWARVGPRRRRTLPWPFTLGSNEAKLEKLEHLQMAGDAAIPWNHFLGGRRPPDPSGRWRGHQFPEQSRKNQPATAAHQGSQVTWLQLGMTKPKIEWGAIRSSNPGRYASFDAREKTRLLSISTPLQSFHSSQSFATGGPLPIGLKLTSRPLIHKNVVVCEKKRLKNALAPRRVRKNSLPIDVGPADAGDGLASAANPG